MVTVETLERKIGQTRNKEIEEIIDAQKVIDEIIVANSDYIKRIDKEIQQLIYGKY